MDIKKIVLGPVQTNCYLVSDSGKAAIIDPAIYSKNLFAYIEQNGLKVEYILLTHAHFDHIFGAKQFSEAFGAPVAIGKGDAPALSDPMQNGSLILGGTEGEPPEANLLLSEGDSLALGSVDIRVLDTPGHTQGHISYVADLACFCGDTIFQRSVGRTDLYGGDFDVLEESIRRKIYTLDEATKLYPGHMGSTSVAKERAENPYVRP